MIAIQDWLAPLLGSIVVLAVPLIIGMMANTIVRRIRSDDARLHEKYLDRKELLSRKDDERNRLKVEAQWVRLESYVRARNLCFLTALAVVEVNVILIVLVLTGNSPILSISLLVVFIAIFVAAARMALKKPVRPIWATTPGYYRDLAVGPRKEGSA